MTHQRKENPQKAQSKQWLAEALLTLLKNTPYQEITITALTQQADLARRTFYRHFTTVDDVMTYYLEHICDEFIAQLADLTQLDFQTLMLRFFDFWQDYRIFLHSLAINQRLFLLLQVFMPKLRDRLIGEAVDPEVYYFIAGGLWNLLINSLDSANDWSTEEFKELANRILVHLESTPKLHPTENINASTSIITPIGDVSSYAEQFGHSSK